MGAAPAAGVVGLAGARTPLVVVDVRVVGEEPGAAVSATFVVVVVLSTGAEDGACGPTPDASTKRPPLRKEGGRLARTPTW